MSTVLARDRYREERKEEGCEVYYGAIASGNKVFSDRHSNIISIRNNLANTLGYQGKFAEADQIRKEVLEKRQCILDNKHLDTIVAKNNLVIKKEVV